MQPATNFDKETLERIKLEKEIAELNRPFLRRPAFYGIVGPILLAAFSLGVGFYTGIFDLEKKNLEIAKTALGNENTILEIKRNKLEADTELARSDLAAAEAEFEQRSADISRNLDDARENLRVEEARIAQQLVDGRRELDEKLAAERAKTAGLIDAERARLDAEKAALRAAFEAERADLNDRLAGLSDDVEKKQAQLDELKRQLAHPQTYALLEDLQQSDGAVWQQNSMEKLIEWASRDAVVRGIIEQEAQLATDIRFRAGLLFLLHQADPSEARLSDFIGFIETNVDQPKAWELIGAGWQPDDGMRLLDLLILHSGKGTLNDRSLYETSFFFYLPQPEHVKLVSRMRQDDARALVRQALALAAEPEAYFVTRLYLVRLISYRDPMLAQIVAVHALKDPKTNAHDQFTLRLRQIATGVRTTDPFLTHEMRASGLRAAINDGRLDAWLASDGRDVVYSALTTRDIDGALTLSDTRWREANAN